MKGRIAAPSSRDSTVRAGKARPDRTQWGLGLSTEEVVLAEPSDLVNLSLQWSHPIWGGIAAGT